MSASHSFNVMLKSPKKNRAHFLGVRRLAAVFPTREYGTVGPGEACLTQEN
jgi:hypothetical protein